MNGGAEVRSRAMSHDGERSFGSVENVGVSRSH